MSTWLDQIFQAQSANGGVVRRSRADVDALASLPDIVDAAKERGFLVVETGGQIVILCRQGQIIIHC